MRKSQKQNEFRYLRGSKNPESNIIAVGGGKGGVGKSFMSSSIALFLAQMGYKTVLVDLDLGSANLHTYLGAGLPKLSLHDYFADPHLKLNSVMTKINRPNLYLVSGATNDFETEDVTERQRSRLMSSLYQLKADYIILDLSAGTYAHTLDFFLMATQRTVVMTPDPVSVENAYRFMKAAFYRRIKRYEHQLNLQDEISHILANKQENGVKTPGDLLHFIHSNNPKQGSQLIDLMNDFSIDIVLNQGRSHKDAQLGPSIKSVCNKYFGIPCDVLGSVEYDNAVWQSLRRQSHLLIENPQSRLHTQLMNISRNITKSKQKLKAVV